MRRAVGVLTLLIMLATPAWAGVEFGESSQGALGLSGQGVAVEGAEGMGNYDEAWELFTQTIEGARILGRLDSSREFEITVEVMTAEEYGDDTVWGESILFKQPNDRGQKRVKVTVIKDDSRTVKQIANTFYHEFRHVEHWLDGDFDEGHDNIHDYTDAGMSRYSGQAMEIVSGTSSTTTTSIPPTRTPIYDALMEQAANRNNFLFDAPALHRIFDEIGEALDSIRQREDEAVYLEVIDIDAYMYNKGSFGSLGVELDFNESVFECGEASLLRRVVCADVVNDMATGEVLIAGMQMVAPIPLADPDRSYIYSLVVDSDGDGANDWQFRQPFDWDLFQGTDRWYQLMWDHRAMQWSLTVTQLTSSGGFPSSTEASSVRAVVIGDTIVFFVSMEEFSVPEPRLRLTTFHHDGAFGEATRGADVSGADPTVPLEIVPTQVIDFGW